MGLGRTNCDETSSTLGVGPAHWRKNLKTKCRACCPVRRLYGEADGQRDDGTGRSSRCLLHASARQSPVGRLWHRVVQRRGRLPPLRFDLDQLNWHGCACHEAERYQAQAMEALPVGLLGRLYYLSKILKLSINRERRTSLIKIIHALLASPAYRSASPYSQDSS